MGKIAHQSGIAGNLLRSYKFLNDETNPHFPPEIAETALDVLIHRKYTKNFPSTHNPLKIVGDLLKSLALRLPTESWRSQEQLKLRVGEVRNN